jgi:hypothetical protein
MFTQKTAFWFGIGGALTGILSTVAVLVFFVWPVSKAAAIGGIVFTMVICLILYRLMIAPIMRSSRLNKMGIPARARVLDVEDTGITINKNPQVKLLLEIKDQQGRVYQTHCRTLVSRLHPGMYLPGMEVHVKVDPANEKNVMIFN